MQAARRPCRILDTAVGRTIGLAARTATPRPTQPTPSQASRVRPAGLAAGARHQDDDLRRPRSDDHHRSRTTLSSGLDARRQQFRRHHHRQCQDPRPGGCRQPIGRHQHRFEAVRLRRQRFPLRRQRPGQPFRRRRQRPSLRLRPTGPNSNGNLYNGLHGDARRRHARVGQRHLGDRRRRRLRHRFVRTLCPTR